MATHITSLISLDNVSQNVDEIVLEPLVLPNISIGHSTVYGGSCVSSMSLDDDLEILIAREDTGCKEGHGSSACKKK